MKELHTYGAAVTPFNMQYAISNSGLKWVMSPAQWTSVQMWHLNNSVVTIKEDKETKNTEVFVNNASSFFGIPVEIIGDFYNGWIELRLNDETIFKIDQLAVPQGFSE